VTLRLRFADRPEYELAFDVSDDVEDAWDLLRSRADDRGRVTLGDRDSCPIDEVVDVTIVEREPVEGPLWERGLQDEDVATALAEDYDPPA